MWLQKITFIFHVFWKHDTNCQEDKKDISNKFYRFIEIQIWRFNKVVIGVWLNGHFILQFFGVNFKSEINLVISKNDAWRYSKQVDKCHERLAESLVCAREWNISTFVLHSKSTFCCVFFRQSENLRLIKTLSIVQTLCFVGLTICYQ